MTNNMSAINFSVELAALWQAYQKCLRHKRAKRSAATFSAALADNLLTLQERLVGNSWQPSPSTAFVIKDPKPREIHAATFSDRIVHHWLVPRLESLFEPIFIHDVYSNRKGKGTHKAAQRLAHFMRGLAQPAYYLQLDIHNFFNSIDKAILLTLLADRLAKGSSSGKLPLPTARFYYLLCQRIVNASNQPHMLASCQELALVPQHKRLSTCPPGKGLPIGNLTSQFFANVYLNPLDQFVKHELKCRHYLRYVDDFILLSNNDEQLLHWRANIKQFLAGTLSLNLKAMTNPQPVNNGANFLGYIVRPHYSLARQRVVGNLKQRLRQWEHSLIGTLGSSAASTGFRLLIDGITTFASLRSCLASYLGHFQHCQHFRLLAALRRRFYWLDLLFEFSAAEIHALKCLPPKNAGFLGQYNHFCQHYPKSLIFMQCARYFYLFDKQIDIFRIQINQLAKRLTLPPERHKFCGRARALRLSRKQLQQLAAWPYPYAIASQAPDKNKKGVYMRYISICHQPEYKS